MRRNEWAQAKQRLNQSRARRQAGVCASAPEQSTHSGMLTRPSAGKRIAPVLLVRQVMRSEGKKLVTLREHDTVRHALRTLLANKTTGAPVVSDDGSLVGVVSLTDLMWAEASGDDANNPLWFNDEGSPFYLLDESEREQEDQVLATPLHQVVQKQVPVTIEPNRQLSEGVLPLSLLRICLPFIHCCMFAFQYEISLFFF